MFLENGNEKESEVVKLILDKYMVSHNCEKICRSLSNNEWVISSKLHENHKLLLLNIMKDK